MSSSFSLDFLQWSAPLLKFNSPTDVHAVAELVSGSNVAGLIQISTHPFTDLHIQPGANPQAVARRGCCSDVNGAPLPPFNASPMFREPSRYSCCHAARTDGRKIQPCGPVTS